MTLNAHNQYGSFFVETEALIAMREKDAPYANLVLNQMTASERREFRKQLFELYFVVGRGLTNVADIEEMMGELMRIADDTAPS